LNKSSAINAISVGKASGVLITDHRNLTYFQKAQKLSDRQARWSLFLSEFDIKFQHLPFTHCSMDLITDLPPVEGSDSILVVVDQGLLKGVILCPTTKMVTMDGIGNLLHENLYKRFELPDKMISDRGPQFAAKAFKAMLSRLGVNLVLSTAYHPQTDGTTE
jgi:hypothetical protein